MRHYHYRTKLLAGVGGALLIAGCGSQTGAPKPVATQGVIATPVPTALVGFASLAAPTLDATYREGAALLHLLEHTHRSDMETLGNQCSQYGGDFSNFETSFSSSYIPSPTSKVHQSGSEAYKLLLNSTIECGNAADAGSSSQLKTAISDLKAGLGGIKRAAATVAPWFHTPQR